MLDLIANNTDRKSGHCLLAGDRVWAIDNGLCFAAPFKLRTVIWEFADEPIDDSVLSRVDALADVGAAGVGDVARRRRGGGAAVPGDQAA